MSKIMAMFLGSVGILVAGIISVVITDDITGLVFCSFVFWVIIWELNEELMLLEELEELEERLHGQETNYYDGKKDC